MIWFFVSFICLLSCSFYWLNVLMLELLSLRRELIFPSFSKILFFNSSFSLLSFWSPCFAYYNSWSACFKRVYNCNFSSFLVRIALPSLSISWEASISFLLLSLTSSANLLFKASFYIFNELIVCSYPDLLLPRSNSYLCTASSDYLNFPFRIRTYSYLCFRLLDILSSYLSYWLKRLWLSKTFLSASEAALSLLYKS